MPKTSPSQLQRGVSFHRAGDPHKAVVAYQHHVAVNPGDKLGHYHLALAFEACDRKDAALHAYARAIEIDSYYPEALNNIGILLHSQGKFDAARLCFARALAARPGYADAEYNYATAESCAGNHPAALMHFSRVLEGNPDRADAWNNLAKVFLSLRQPAEALRASRLSLALDPNCVEARWNKSIAALTLGQLPQGWDGFDGRAPLRHTALPRWKGESLTGKRLLIHAEQGFGDTIQFVRYCSQVHKGHSTLECHPALIPLFGGIEGIDELLPFGAPLPSVDYQIPLMSLPELFRTTLATVPANVPYMKPQTALTAHWQTRLSAPVHSLRVGLVWAGNSNHFNDHNRSLDPALLAPLSKLKQVSFYCLQQKPLSAAVPDIPLEFAGVFDELTWPDTAAILANLDLVISVDTAVAHLAGAMARPVWTLLPFAPDWRWMLDRNDTPWYPAMRLFRQPRANDWRSVIGQVAGELERVVHQIV